jgi:phosphoglycerate kinase
MKMKKTIRDVNVRGRCVLVRVDFNVPLEGGKVLDDTRIRASLPTIRYLLEQRAKVVLMSHLGRPKGVDENLRLDPVAQRLQELLEKRVLKTSDCIGKKVEGTIAAMAQGEVLLLENLRFHPEEEQNDPQFALKLARLGDIYVNDAFGSAHRAHASTEGIAHFCTAVAGFLMEKELAFLGKALDHPERPFVAILGGAKISDKIGVIRNLLPKVDALLIGGGLANNFMAAKGIPLGESLIEKESIKTAQEILRESGEKIHLPEDAIAAKAFSGDAGRVRFR